MIRNCWWVNKSCHWLFVFQADVDSWVSGESVVDINALVTYIFMELTYGNWQRPAVGVRMTLTEARAHQDSGSDVISLTVGLHKTTSSQEPAVIIMRGAARAAYLHCIDNIRSSLPTKSSNSELALVTSNGRPLVNYADLIKTLLRHYLVVDRIVAKNEWDGPSRAHAATCWTWPSLVGAF